jgi:hypothetical protein
MDGLGGPVGPLLPNCFSSESFFRQTSRMFTDAFDEVDWPHVHRTLNDEVPRLFQVWACKQVMNIAATNKI